MSVLADAWRIAFLLAAAPVVGTVLLLAIGRLTGARWQGYLAPARLAPTLAVAVGAGVTGLATAQAPPHLSLWMAPLAVTARGIAAGLLLAWASRHLRRGAGPTGAAVVLAIYAVLVTPVAADWLLGQVPGHPVSAIGMIWTVQVVLGACGFLLVSGMGDEQTRADWSRLGVAAALGLAYLGFMDYLIVWFGNLPTRIGFYLARERPVLVWGALLLGLAVPIAGLSLLERERGRKLAGGAMLGGLFLFDAWWVGASPWAAPLALLPVALAGAAGAWLVRREARGG